MVNVEATQERENKGQHAQKKRAFDSSVQLQGDCVSQAI